MTDRCPGLAEHQCRGGIVIAQQVEDCVLAVARRDIQCPVFDIDMLARLACGVQSQGVALEILGQFGNPGGHGGGKHQGAALGRGGGKDEFQILAKAEVKHLVGLVQHRRAQTRQIKAVALDMVAQPPRRADHDMRAAIKGALFGAVIHAADAGRDLRPGLGVKPVELARYLQRQLAGRRDDQRHRHIGEQQPVGPAQQFVGNRDAEGGGLARAGLGRNQQVAPHGCGGPNGLLHRGEGVIALGRQRRCQRCGNINLCHVRPCGARLAPDDAKSAAPHPHRRLASAPPAAGILGP